MATPPGAQPTPKGKSTIIPSSAPQVDPSVRSADDILKQVGDNRVGSNAENNVNATKEFPVIKQPTQLPTNIQNPQGFGYIAGDEESEKIKTSKADIAGSDVDASTVDVGDLPALEQGEDTSKYYDASGAIRPEVQAKIAQQKAEQRKQELVAAQGSINENLSQEENTGQDDGKGNNQNQNTNNQPFQTRSAREDASNAYKNAKDAGAGNARSLANAAGAGLRTAGTNAVKNSLNNSAIGQSAARAIDTAQKATQTVKNVKTVATVVRTAATVLNPGSISVIVIIVLIGLLLSLVYGLWSVFNRRDELGAGGNQFFYTGLTSPEACTRSAMEAVFGIAARKAIDDTGTDLLTLDSQGLLTETGKATLNQYARFAALTVQATSNLIRYGEVEDRSIDNPTEDGLNPNPYRDSTNPEGSGVKINQELGGLIERYLSTTVTANLNSPAPTKQDTLLKYDRDVATAKIEGAGLALEPGATVLSYKLPPRIQYFDTSSIATITGGTSGSGQRQIVGGPIAIRNSANPAEIALDPQTTRQTILSESFGATRDDFAPQPEPEQSEPFTLGYEFDDKGQPYRKGTNPRQYIYLIDDKGTPDDPSDDTAYIDNSGTRRDLTQNETNLLLNGYKIDNAGLFFLELEDGRALYKDEKGTATESDDQYYTVKDGVRTDIEIGEGRALESEARSVTPPQLPGSAEARLTDGSLVSFKSFSLGVGVLVSFSGVRIWLISDIIEGIINALLSFLNFTISSSPVLSSGYYRAANIGSFGSTLLNRYDANLAQPFQNYTRHTFINDQNQAVQDLRAAYLDNGINNAGGIPRVDPGNSRPIEGIAPDGKSIDGSPEDRAREAVQNSPEIQRAQEAQAKAQGGLTGASSPALAEFWQSQRGPYAIRDAMKNITDLFLQAGNSPRVVSGINVSARFNIALNITVTPPAVIPTIGLPTINGVYAQKTITNAPNGREYLDLYNRVGMAVLRASADSQWTQSTVEAPQFNSGIFADGSGIAEDVEEWIGECDSGRYDVAKTDGVSTAFTQINGLNSCKLYDKTPTGTGFAAYDQYLPGNAETRNGEQVVVKPNGELDPRYLSPQEKQKLRDLGIQDRRDYYESIIMAEAKAQGIDPTDGKSDELDRTKLAFMLAVAAYETNAASSPLGRAAQENDFVRFSEINPVAFPELSEVFGRFGNQPIDQAVLGTINDILIRPVETQFQNAFPNNNTDRLPNDAATQDIMIILLQAAAGINESYGSLGKGVTEIGFGALNGLVDKFTGVLGEFADVEVDLQSIIKKWYKARVTGNALSGFFDNDTIGYVFDPDQNGAMYYGRGFALSATRGRGVYKQLQEALGKSLVADSVTNAPGNPNLVRQDPSTMAQVLVTAMKQGIFTGYRLDDFFAADRADPINARAIIDPNYIFVTGGLQPNSDVLGTQNATGQATTNSPNDPNRNPETVEPDKFFVERYKYYYNKLGSVDKSFYESARQVCNTAPDGKMFKDNQAVNACLAEGFNYVNISDPKNKYQSYGFTITANRGAAINPIYGGEILYSNFATRPPPTSNNNNSSASSSSINENDLLQRRQKGDPVSGNQISIVSVVNDSLYVIRYTNLDGNNPPPVGLAPGTPVNKDDIIGYVGNSGSQLNDGSQTQVRVEIVQYYGAALERRTEEIFAAVKNTGEFRNPMYHIKTQITSEDGDAMRVCNSSRPELYQNLNQYPLSAVQGVTIPGKTIPFDTWLLLR